MPEPLARHAREARRVAGRLTVAMSLLYGALALAQSGLMPLWLCAVICGVATARYIGYSHALVHRATDRFPFVYELLFPAVTPLMPGFGQVREIHLRHHATATGEDDPERWAVCPRSRIAVLIRCAFMYEWWWLFSLRTFPASRARWTGIAGRGALFGFLVWGLDPWTVVVGLVLPAKVATMTGFWRVSWRAHYRDGVAGSYDLHDGRALRLVRDLVVGRYATDVIRFHARHHARPGLSVLALRSLPSRSS